METLQNKNQQSEQGWMERTGLDENSLCGVIETIIFVSDRPVKIQKIRDRLDKEMPLRVIHEGLKRLQENYEQPHHGIHLVEVGEGFQFRTMATYAKFVQDIFKPSSLILSPIALEVLAIIAYRQPVSRAGIDKIRGVDSSHILRALIDKRLVQVSGRSDDVGRPVVYGTTNEFLEMFNLSQLEDLPPEHELNSLADNQDVGEISDIKELVNSSGQLHEKFNFDEMSELDELAKTIKEVSPHTSFTQAIKEEEKKRKTLGTIEEKSAFEFLEEFVNSNCHTNNEEEIKQSPLNEEAHTHRQGVCPNPQEKTPSPLRPLTIEERPQRADKLEADLERALAQLNPDNERGEMAQPIEINEDITQEKSSNPSSQELP